MGVQASLRRTDPHLFENDRYFGQDYRDARDDSRYNDPEFRSYQAMLACTPGGLTGPHRYWTLRYCQRELQPYVERTNFIFDILIGPPPSSPPTAIEVVINRWINGLKRLSDPALAGIGLLCGAVYVSSFIITSGVIFSSMITAVSLVAILHFVGQ